MTSCECNREGPQWQTEVFLSCNKIAITLAQGSLPQTDTLQLQWEQNEFLLHLIIFPGDFRSMPNMMLPPEERNLTPEQVEALDRRRDWGLTLQVIAGQFAVISTLLSLWAGQDLTYSPGWAHPMAYYMAIAVSIVLVAGSVGTYMRRGTVRID